MEDTIQAQRIQEGDGADAASTSGVAPPQRIQESVARVARVVRVAQQVCEAVEKSLDQKVAGETGAKSESRKRGTRTTVSSRRRHR